MKLKKTLSAWLGTRYQLVIRNKEDLAEKSAFSFSYAKLIFLGTALFVLMTWASLLLSTSILARWLNPVRIDQENKKKLVALATAVEALEIQTVQQEKFITLLQSMISGKELPAELQGQVLTKMPEEGKEMAATLPESEEDQTPLPPPGAENESARISPYKHSMEDLENILLFPPVSGRITAPFRNNIEHYGVDLAAREREPIKTVADGIVVFASWTVDTGWVMIIQHSKDLLSVYKHNASLLQKVGSFVKAGDVIAIMGNSGELSTGPHLHFELWYEGNPVDPEHFIAF